MTALEGSAHCVTAPSGHCCSCSYCHAGASCLPRRIRWPVVPLPPFHRALDGADDCSAPLMNIQRTDRPDHRRFDAAHDAIAAGGEGGVAVDAVVENVEDSVGSDAAGDGYSARSCVAVLAERI